MAEMFLELRNTGTIRLDTDERIKVMVRVEGSSTRVIVIVNGDGTIETNMGTYQLGQDGILSLTHTFLQG